MSQNSQNSLKLVRYVFLNYGYFDMVPTSPMGNEVVSVDFGVGSESLVSLFILLKDPDKIYIWHLLTAMQGDVKCSLYKGVEL